MCKIYVKFYCLQDRRTFVREERKKKDSADYVNGKKVIIQSLTDLQIGSCFHGSHVDKRVCTTEPSSLSESGEPSPCHCRLPLKSNTQSSLLFLECAVSLFQHCFDNKNGLNLTISYNSVLDKSAACISHWRKVVLTIPSFWSYIQILLVQINSQDMSQTPRRLLDVIPSGKM